MNRHSFTLSALAIIFFISLSSALAKAESQQHMVGKNASPILLARASGKITILSPHNGASLDSGSGIALQYNIKLSPDGNHVHVYIDDHSPIIDRNVENCPCTITLPDLSPGKHTIVMKEATVSHVLTGVEDKVSIDVK